MTIDKTHLFRLLAALDAQTQAQLLRHIRHNNGTNGLIPQLLTVLHDAVANQKTLSRQQVWAAIASEEPYHKLKLRTLYAKLLRQTENWLIIENMQPHDNERSRQLCQHFTQQNKPEMANFYYEKAVSEKKVVQHKNPIFYYQTLLDDAMKIEVTP